jgi:hypothetical protein
MGMEITGFFSVLDGVRMVLEFVGSVMVIGLGWVLVLGMFR